MYAGDLMQTSLVDHCKEQEKSLPLVTFLMVAREGEHMQDGPVAL